MGVHGALQNEVPMVVMSGESQTLGEDPDLDIEQQWYGGLTIGGIERFVEPVAKWARAVTSPFTLYETVIRAGEMAQRVPKGPIYLNVALEHMLHEWTALTDARGVPPAPMLQPRAQDIEEVAGLLGFQAPRHCGGDVGKRARGFSGPGRSGGSPCYSGYQRPRQCVRELPDRPSLVPRHGQLRRCGKCRSCPPRRRAGAVVPAQRRPTSGKIVAVNDNPLKGHMVYQNLHIDFYLEGDMAEALRLLTAALKNSKIDASAVAARRQRWSREHESYVAGLRTERAKAHNGSAIAPVSLMGAPPTQCHQIRSM